VHNATCQAPKYRLGQQRPRNQIPRNRLRANSKKNSVLPAKATIMFLAP
jgi:hypothetical protein